MYLRAKLGGDGEVWCSDIVDSQFVKSLGLLVCHFTLGFTRNPQPPRRQGDLVLLQAYYSCYVCCLVIKCKHFEKSEHWYSAGMEVATTQQESNLMYTLLSNIYLHHTIQLHKPTKMLAEYKFLRIQQH